LTISKEKGFTRESCHTFYFNLENLYTQHKLYASDHIWNSYKIWIQKRHQSSAKVWVTQGSWDVYGTILKSWVGWLNCIINVVQVTLLAFYIFKCSRMWKDHIWDYRLGTCMAMQKLRWKFALSINGWSFLQICSKGGFLRKLTSLYSRWAWFSCYNTSIGTNSTLRAHTSYAL
jgi:hypothetical protein